MKRSNLQKYIDGSLVQIGIKNGGIEFVDIANSDRMTTESTVADLDACVLVYISSASKTDLLSFTQLECYNINSAGGMCSVLDILLSCAFGSDTESRQDAYAGKYCSYDSVCQEVYMSTYIPGPWAGTYSTATNIHVESEGYVNIKAEPYIHPGNLYYSWYSKSYGILKEAKVSADINTVMAVNSIFMCPHLISVVCLGDSSVASSLLGTGLYRWRDIALGYICSSQSIPPLMEVSSLVSYWGSVDKMMEFEDYVAVTCSNVPMINRDASARGFIATDNFKLTQSNSFAVTALGLLRQINTMVMRSVSSSTAQTAPVHTAYRESGSQISGIVIPRVRGNSLAMSTSSRNFMLNLLTVDNITDWLDRPCKEVEIYLESVFGIELPSNLARACEVLYTSKIEYNESKELSSLIARKYIDSTSAATMLYRALVDSGILSKLTDDANKTIACLMQRGDARKRFLENTRVNIKYWKSLMELNTEGTRKVEEFREKVEKKLCSRRYTSLRDSEIERRLSRVRQNSYGSCVDPSLDECEVLSDEEIIAVGIFKQMSKSTRQRLERVTKFLADADQSVLLRGFVFGFNSFNDLMFPEYKLQLVTRDPAYVHGMTFKLHYATDSSGTSHMGAPSSYSKVFSYTASMSDVNSLLGILADPSWANKAEYGSGPIHLGTALYEMLTNGGKLRPKELPFKKSQYKSLVMHDKSYFSSAIYNGSMNSFTTRATSSYSIHQIHLAAALPDTGWNIEGGGTTKPTSHTGIQSNRGYPICLDMPKAIKGSGSTFDSDYLESIDVSHVCSDVLNVREMMERSVLLMARVIGDVLYYSMPSLVSCTKSTNTSSEPGKGIRGIVYAQDDAGYSGYRKSIRGFMETSISDGVSGCTSEFVSLVGAKKSPSSMVVSVNLESFIEACHHDGTYLSEAVMEYISCFSQHKNLLPPRTMGISMYFIANISKDEILSKLTKEEASRLKSALDLAILSFRDFVKLGYVSDMYDKLYTLIGKLDNKLS